MKEDADVIIIGGGIHGASLAFHLSQRNLQVIVLERKFIGAGATGRSSGLVRMHYDLELESRLAWVSFSYFRQWEDKVGGECGFTRTGFIQIVPPEHNDLLRANVQLQQKIGIPTFLITADDVRRLAPYFRTDDFEYAAYEPESGYAAPYLALTSMMNAAKERGTRLFQGQEVVDVLTRGDKIYGVRTTQEEFHAPVVVNAAGAWAKQVGQMVGLELPLTTWRHDTMFIRRPPIIGPTHPTVIDNALDMYFRPETGGLTLVGLEDGNVLGESPDQDADRPKAGFVERAVERICQRIPIMEQGSLHSAHGGYDGLSQDQHAVLGPAGPDGFYLQCGFSGTGFKVAPAVGLCMAEWIVDGAPKTVDITPFTLDRFETGQLLRGKYAYGDIWH